MAGRAFRVKIHLEVHAVTCPGVWLCPNGKVALRINTLDSCVETRRINPIFPLLFHDKFTFEKVFARRISLTELQKALEQELFYAELVQWTTPASRGIILAAFDRNLVDLLYPAPCFKGLLAGVDIDLLMEPTKCFPGIIAPKIEVSTKTIVEEIVDFYDTSISGSHVINPKMINSKQCERRKKPSKGIIRQRRVCHVKSRPRSQSCRPYRQEANDSHQCSSCTTNRQVDQCHRSRRNSVCTCRSDLLELDEPIVIRDKSHVTDNCPVCFKYNYYFPKCRDDSIKKHVDTFSEQRYCKNRECRCIHENDTFDTQKEITTSTLQSKVGNFQEAKERYITEVTDNVRDNSLSHEFYKNLERFYKRMYKQAKLHAQETDA